MQIIRELKKKTSNELLRIGLILMIPMLILAPEIRITSPAIRADEILLFILAIGCLYNNYKTKRYKTSVVDYIFGALFISTLVSILFSYTGIGYEFFYRDMFEFVKLVKYYLIYRVVYSLEWDSASLKDVVKVTVISFLVAMLFAFMQYFDVFSVNNYVMPTFTKTIHIRAIMVAGRVVGLNKATL